MLSSVVECNCKPSQMRERQLFPHTSDVFPDHGSTRCRIRLWCSIHRSLFYIFLSSFHIIAGWKIDLPRCRTCRTCADILLMERSISCRKSNYRSQRPPLAAYLFQSRFSSLNHEWWRHRNRRTEISECLCRFRTYIYYRLPERVSRVARYDPDGNRAERPADGLATDDSQKSPNGIVFDTYI